MKNCHILVYIISNLMRILVCFQFLDNLIFFLVDFNYIMCQFQQLIRFIMNHLALNINHSRFLIFLGKK